MSQDGMDPPMVPISPIGDPPTHQPSLQSPFMLFRSPAGSSPADFIMPSGSSLGMSQFGEGMSFGASPGMTGFGQSPGIGGQGTNSGYNESPFAMFAAQLPMLGTPGLMEAFLPSPAASNPPWALHGDLSPRQPALRPQRLSFNQQADAAEQPSVRRSEYSQREIFNPFADERVGVKEEYRKPKNKGVRQPNGTSGIIKPCSCKKSRCLKKYCECFASNRYCDGCFCTNCQNLPNPPPIVEDPEPPIRNLPVNHAYHEEREPKLDANGNPIVPKGCHCKKSQCIKKYCECFNLGVLCSAKCECRDCKNKTWDSHNPEGGVGPTVSIRRAVKPTKRVPVPRTTGYRVLGNSSSPSEEADLRYGGHDLEWSHAESGRGVKRQSVPMFGAHEMGAPPSPTKRAARGRSPSGENAADQSDLDITFSAMGEGLEEMMEPVY